MRLDVVTQGSAWSSQKLPTRYSIGTFLCSYIILGYFGVINHVLQGEISRKPRRDSSSQGRIRD